MMAARSAWRLLGIGPTGDRRVIRRAYAARLKAIDPDQDVAGFLKLREALATAERAAERLADGEASVDEPVYRVFDHDVAPVSPSAAVKEVAPALDPAMAPAIDALPDPRWVFEAALFPGDEPFEPRRLIDAATALLADERMGQVDFAAETEQWLAFALTHADARASDAVLPMLAAHFDWHAELGAARRRPDIAYLAQRASDLAAIAALRDPWHRLHEPFVVLQRPAPERLALADRLRLGDGVAELIASLRYHNPGVEALFDAGHVALWAEVAPSRPAAPRLWGVSWYGWLILAALLVMAIRAFIELAG